MLPCSLQMRMFGSFTTSGWQRGQSFSATACLQSASFEAPATVAVAAFPSPGADPEGEQPGSIPPADTSRNSQTARRTGKVDIETSLKRNDSPVQTRFTHEPGH